MSSVAAVPCGPVLHVLVVGFHHKRGCQVDFSFPPLMPGNAPDNPELPDKWKYLPPLALPDGAHNTTEDTIYFHLPSLDKSQQTVFGISCYRQMDAQELLHRENDVTRNTVQKSVCVLSTIPLYGLIKAKLELITHAYFKERDFSKVSLLEETYTNLNASLNTNMLQGTQVFLGMSGRDVVQHFKHKILVLFKLILLERRVLFFTAPVEPICSTMLTILSLFPGMIENGLVESANYSPDDHPDPSYDYGEFQSSTRRPPPTETSSDDLLSPDANSRSQSSQSLASVGKPESLSANPAALASAGDAKETSGADGISSETSAYKSQHSSQQTASKNSGGDHNVDIHAASGYLQRSFSIEESSGDTLATDRHMEDLLEVEDCFNWDEDKLLLKIDDALLGSDISRGHSPDHGRCVEVTNLHKSEQTTSKDSVHTGMSSSSSSNSISGKPSKHKKKKGKKHKKVHPDVYDNRPPSPSSIHTDEYGFPLAVFTKGNLCHPYLCLQYFDLLSDTNVHGFAIGATNQLFKRKRHLVDVVVEIAESKLDINDADLKRQLTLSTADLRFADFLVRNVSDDRGDIFLDDTEWEGGDEWLRSQFRMYLLSMLATVTFNDDKLLVEDFNSHFVSAWKQTRNYRLWRASLPEAVRAVTPGHPFQGQLSMSDMKLKLSHSMQSTERGKKINAVMQQTGKVVFSTSRAVGGAFASAKSTMLSWFTGIGSASSGTDSAPSYSSPQEPVTDSRRS